jgi:Ca2+-binding EF-hand superfamily protein/heme exporter protein D
MCGSFAVLLWSVVVLALVQMLMALVLQSLLEKYILDEQNPEAARKEVYKFYGTFARSMLTLFEMTLGNWMPPCRALVENVSEWWMLFSLAHKLVIGFSVVSVITSVFIQETFKVAAIDDKIMIMSTERARKMHIRKINALFGYTDHDGNGFLDVGEFTTVLQDSGIRTWLASMGLQVRDIPQFFQLLDVDGNGRLTVKELVEGISVLKGTATSYDMKIVENCNLKLKEDLQIVQTQLKRIGDRCQAVQSAEPTIMQAV